MIVVVMGVAGAGKSVVGAALAERLDCRFIEGDVFHPEANVARMRSGVALTDADRKPWLDRLAAELDACRSEGRDGVLACSALKRSYRERLVGGNPDVRFVHLTASRPLLEERLRSRPGHFMSPALVESQLATLEPPAEGEPAVVFASEPPLDELVERIAASLEPVR